MKKLNDKKTKTFIISGLLMLLLSITLRQFTSVSDTVLGICAGVGVGLLINSLFRGKPKKAQ